VSFLRRREPHHVRLAREAGLDVGGGEAEPAGPPWDTSRIHGIHRAREWDTVTTVATADLPGDRIAFVALPNGELVADEGGEDLSVLAAALALEPPYRAEAGRRNETLWALAARTIEVVELPGVDGEEIELASHGGERTLRIDGERVFGSVPTLERDGHVVRARRAAGEAWEVETDPL
jgi:hypothetical protein